MQTVFGGRGAGEAGGVSFLLNAIALAGICVSLLAAFYFQLALGEIPCPLCMLQRVGVMLVGFGFAMNVRFGASAVHYAIVILSSIAGAGVSLRQDLLHISPRDPGFGSVVFGYHMYTWGFILFVASIAFCAVMLIIDRQKLDQADNGFGGAGRGAVSMGGGARSKAGPPGSVVAIILITLLLLLSVGNLTSDVLTCGAAPCADNPAGYIFQHSSQNTHPAP